MSSRSRRGDDTADVQLLVDDEADRTALGELLTRGGYTYTTGESLAPVDLFVVDDYSLPRYREALRGETRERSPVFCPVVLVYREGTQLDLTADDAAPAEGPTLVDETVAAPVDPQVLFRRLSNLLVRQQQTEELAERNERLDEFARKVSHELRNPLNVLAGRLELARETGDTDHLDAMEQPLERMDRLVDDVLSLARTGDVSVDPTRLDLAAVVESCWESVDTSDAALEVTDAPTVVADEDRLHQLLANLFRNAVEHGSPSEQDAAGSVDAVGHGGSSVTVSVGSLSDGFYVADDGPGIPADERDAVFERGYSGDEHGTGLGLAVVAEVASAHGWELDVTDSESGGARFEFRGVELQGAEHGSSAGA